MNAEMAVIPGVGAADPRVGGPDPWDNGHLGVHVASAEVVKHMLHIVVCLQTADELQDVIDLGLLKLRL